ncbi:hypothetical protein P3T76_002273 [Phytophthora citrophthora]|uniref:Crinkler (CRN) family protein n=1 Tax=Phytophthora citrophthora TaxID=4793 RepID=A0AAD9GY54_9STRA|nr:hypothetical protein P3T76_002273 [Phytophthora citrophthora]
MTTQVWSQLVDAATRSTYGNTQAVAKKADVDGLCAVVSMMSRTLHPWLDTTNLRVYANRATYDAENAQPLTSWTSVIGLGLLGEDPLIVEVPQQEYDEPKRFQLTLDGVNIQTPHLAREDLLRRVYDTMQLGHRYTLFMSPAASGKTSLLWLFTHIYPALNCIYASFLDPETSAVDILRPCGVDLTGRTTNTSEDQHYVFMLDDDAQAKYHEKGFWSTLIKVAPWWLSNNVRFIISATHAFDGGTESPVQFQSLRKFGRQDFLLSDDEACEFLALSSTGLQDVMKKKQDFTQLLVRECNGPVGALRISVDAVNDHFAKRPAAPETQLVSYYLSQDLLYQMERCFGSMHLRPTSLELRQFLIECLVAAPSDLYLKSKLTDEDIRYLLTLKKIGYSLDRCVKFSSPLAEKYFSKWLFPTRARANPLSLHELITKVLGNMSASVLQKFVVDATNFPKEATFQSLFMEGLKLHTRSACSICPELSRIYDDGPKEQLTFYLNEGLQWGLELHVNEDGISEEITRFAPGRKYAPFAMNDYAIIDLRGNETGNPEGVILVENWVSVFFQQGNYSSCKCVFGMDEVIYEIPLKA